MKIGILTQPLVNNYGGLLQAWALQQTLHRMGHNAIIIDRHSARREDFRWPRRIASILKTELYILLRKEKRRVILSEEQNIQIRRNIIPFITNRYLGISPQLYTTKALKQYVTSENFEALVVGSDQVWRPCYSPSIGNYFLDFLSPLSKIKRIAYAASFGVDFWEYNNQQTEKFCSLTQKFDLITVRESSGIKLVEDYLKCRASHVLDPTMLLDKEDYIHLINHPSAQLHASNGKLFCYVLDQRPEMNKIIQRAEKETGLKAFFCNAIRKPNTKEDLNHIDECVYPAVEQWLKSFQEAEMVITDSFHGCVFSIIFNKPFWVVRNDERGAARFYSLLNMFKLQDRLITPKEYIDWKRPINWGEINDLRCKMKHTSKHLLSNALNR